MNRTFRVLHVDGNPLDRAIVRGSLERELGGVRVIEAGSSAECESLLDDSIDVVLSDRVIPGYSELQVIEAARVIAPGVPVIIVTGDSCRGGDANRGRAACLHEVAARARVRGNVALCQ